MVVHCKIWRQREEKGNQEKANPCGCQTKKKKKGLPELIEGRGKKNETDDEPIARRQEGPKKIHEFAES